MQTPKPTPPKNNRFRTIMALPFLPNNQMVAEFKMIHANMNMAEPVKASLNMWPTLGLSHQYGTLQTLVL